MVLIGLGPSAFDISREVATVAKEVHITTRAPNVTVGKSDNHENIWLHKMVAFLLYFFFFPYLKLFLIFIYKHEGVW